MTHQRHKFGTTSNGRWGYRDYQLALSTYLERGPALRGDDVLTADSLAA
jgi:hypothetical protein